MVGVNMKFKRISTRMLATILPVIILAMVVLTTVSMRSSRDIINEQISSAMESELAARDGEMGEYLNSVSNMATMIANMVEMNYTVTDMENFEKILGNIIAENDIVLGSGLWFEPYQYDKDQKYMGPYVYKDGDKLVTTYDYSNEEYDYFSQEYYTMCVDATNAQFTDPYYDATSDTVMFSCACPIIVDGKFIGCVTVDIELTSIIQLIDNIKVGETGSAMLTTSQGTYLAGVSDEKVQNSVNITSDENSSLASAGSEIIASESGKTSYSSDGEINLYYSTLESTGWKIILQMPQAELNAPLESLMGIMSVVSIISIVGAVVIVLIQVRSISKGIKLVDLFAGSLAEGDFTVKPIAVKSEDEPGNMSNALNQMYDSNKGVITNIKTHSDEIDDSSKKLQQAAFVLAEKFNEIQKYMNEVNESMVSTSAATQQVNASTEEVLANVNLLATETGNSMAMAEEIQERADKVGNSSKKSFESANALSVQFEKRLQVSIENAKIVESIGELANAISEIAEEINLLSLNASIEAARAGEVGKGFAVVANEIGSLASSTAETVGQIQKTITEVKDAFNGLLTDAKDLLGFIHDTVEPDYSSFVDVAQQYGNDAETISESSNKITGMSEAIKNIMQEVTDAVQSIATATQTTTELSSNIMESINLLSENVSDISSMSDKQESISNDLNEVVSKFTLD